MQYSNTYTYCTYDVRTGGRALAGAELWRFNPSLASPCSSPSRSKSQGIFITRAGIHGSGRDRNNERERGREKRAAEMEQ
jgi:hypothetical protein